MEKPVEVLLRGSKFKEVIEGNFKPIREKYDLKRLEIDILLLLSKFGENNTSSDIMKYLNMNKGHISQSVDSLRKEGYLTAETDKDDRRYVHFFLTEKSNHVIAEIKEIWNQVTLKIFKDISEEELLAFRDTALKIEKNMDNVWKDIKNELYYGLTDEEIASFQKTFRKICKNIEHFMM